MGDRGEVPKPPLPTWNHREIATLCQRPARPAHNAVFIAPNSAWPEPSARGGREWMGLVWCGGRVAGRVDVEGVGRWAVVGPEQEEGENVEETGSPGLALHCRRREGSHPVIARYLVGICCL